MTGPTSLVPGCPMHQHIQVASTSFPNFRIHGSGGRIDLMAPAMDDRVAIEVVDELHDALLELVRRADADMTSTDRAAPAKKPSTRLSQEPCLGVNTTLKRPSGRAASQALVSREMCAE